MLCIQRIYSTLFILALLFCLPAYGEQKEDAPEKEVLPQRDQPKQPPKEGNFALPPSQQPAGLVAFGGNLLNKNELQFYFFGDEFVGNQRVLSDTIPSLLFGLTDNFSIYLNVPFTPKAQDGCYRSTGFEDAFVQLEYAFYNKSTKRYADQATIVVNTTFPTGSVHKKLPIGFGAPSVFLGGTYYHVLVDWFTFAAAGAIVPTVRHRTKFGDQILYQWGMGKNIPSPKGWIYAWMLEVDGQFFRKNLISGSLDKNSGGNMIFATPSLWVSSKHMLLQFGLSFPLQQRWNGKQRKFHLGLNFNFAWSFYAPEEEDKDKPLEK